ncbi:hypothetical protein SAMN05445060_2365 [Williamsia sterculiae]|uniref:Uncharacterized protein n=1 Tax=Williamsia sterculiae TaxID=1344003 RepID=A0A1N7FX42_9NOCA|nr:hypothetical protein SAMN05445060_2365 [Williamsia sterculiae]
MVRNSDPAGAAVGDPITVIAVDGSRWHGVIVAIRHSPISYGEVRLNGVNSKIALPLSAIQHYRTIA